MYQSGFRAMFSSESALLKVANDLLLRAHSKGASMVLRLRYGWAGGRKGRTNLHFCCLYGSPKAVGAENNSPPEQ